jgi:phosphate butyryltransferase
MNKAVNFEQLTENARIALSGKRPPRIAVCAAEDKSSIVAMAEAERAGLAVPILIGDKKEIVRVAAENHIYASSLEIIDVAGNAEKAQAGVALIKAGKADILMKGMLPTSTFLHPIFRHDTGLLTGNFISHVGVLEVAELGRFIIQTDGGLNINPTFEMKKGIIKNAVFVAHLLGIERPKVALLSATEKVHPKIKSTVEARDLAAWAKEAVPDADVEGPMALDIALSPEAAGRKGVAGAVAGNADILVAPDIESGNILYKAIRIFGHAHGAGIVVGAACPVMLTSRSDSPSEKLNSLALAALYAGRIAEAGFRVKKP